MDMGLTNISRTVGRSDVELESKKLQPVAKTSITPGVSGNTEKDKLATNGNELTLKNQSQSDMSNSDLTEIADKINELFQNENRTLQFNVDKDSGRTVIKIMDTATGEQIKQIPAEELLEISRKLASQLEGLDEKAGMLVKSRA